MAMLHVRALFVGRGGYVWVWPPPWVLGVGLVLVLAAGGVAVRRCCCGTLLCFAPLYCVLCAVVCWHVSLCASCRLWSAVLRCVLRCLRVVRYATSVRRGGRGYPGRAAPCISYAKVPN